MFSAFFTGFFLGLSLIVAIGAQNAFVLRHGILQQHVFYIALFCSISDATLIFLGITGISFFFTNFVDQFSNILFGISSIWLSCYGIIRLMSVFKSNSAIDIEKTTVKGLFPTLIALFILTFANPHVYLDTVILIGSIAQQFSGELKVGFAIGACLASFVFFFGLAYGAKLLAPIMQNPNSWRILDGVIAIIMFSIAIKLAVEGNWL
ncbi:LysE/ArgO family amino acid transporter [Candidatus Pseudothioglobus singularis]|nr:LysE/ArgO family amino acid transporter [Candidatus Pseudothioglobus singularis]